MASSSNYKSDSSSMPPPKRRKTSDEVAKALQAREEHKTGTGWTKHHCKAFATHNCMNSVFVAGSFCADCLAMGRDETHTKDLKDNPKHPWLRDDDEKKKDYWDKKETERKEQEWKKLEDAAK